VDTANTWGPDDLAELVKQFASDDDDSEFPVVFRALFAVRWKLGNCLGGTNRAPASASGCARCVSGCPAICSTGLGDRIYERFRGGPRWRGRPSPGRGRFMAGLNQRRRLPAYATASALLTAPLWAWPWRATSEGG
jgi:hypothetical protein